MAGEICKRFSNLRTEKHKSKIIMFGAPGSGKKTILWRLWVKDTKKRFPKAGFNVLEVKVRVKGRRIPITVWDNQQQNARFRYSYKIY